MNTTLRTRLLLAISVTIIVTLCATQYGLYVLIRRQLYSEFDQNLGAKARALAVLIEQDGDAVDVEFQQHPMQDFARSIRPEYYQVWHEDGDVLARSRQLREGNLVRLNGDMVVPLVKAVTLPDGRRGRAAGIRFRPNREEDSLEPPIDSVPDDDDHDADEPNDSDFSGRALVTLVVARDTLDVESSLVGMTWMLVVSGAAAIAVTLTVLAWLVTRNLNPLQSLAHQIGSVSEQSLGEHFELTNAPGELQPVVARLNELLSRLEEAFLREKTFAADVAHELRTPLAGIRSTLEVALSRRREENSYRASMERCLQISEETETIVATLLSLSRIEAGQTTLENDLVELSSVLRRTWQPFAHRVSERGVAVDWICDVPSIIESDLAKLQVVLSNLFDNATSYVDSGGQILIHTQCENDQLEIRVSNTGCELSADQINHVFDRFWRADVARSETGCHSGLGLALTRRIVHFLNGTIKATVSAGRFIATVRLNVTAVEMPNDVEDLTGLIPAQGSRVQSGNADVITI